MPRFRLGVLPLLAAAAVTACLASAAERVDLRPEVRHEQGQVVVHNLTSFDWTDCIIRLNHRWSTNLARLPAGEGVGLGLATFTLAGEPFDPRTEGVQRVTLNCQTPDGGGHREWVGRGQ
jgi:hypothetical protein